MNHHIHVSVIWLGLGCKTLPLWQGSGNFWNVEDRTAEGSQAS